VISPGKRFSGRVNSRAATTRAKTIKINKGEMRVFMKRI
jgi:hypothetical protein